MDKIELKHISILPLQTKLKIYKIQPQNQKALNENSWIDDFQKLKDLYKKQEEYGWDIFTDEIYFEIKDIEDKIEKSNKIGKYPEIYLTQEEPQIYAHSYEKNEIDKLLTGEVLLYGNPLEYSARRVKLSKYSIYELRHFLSHCDTKGKNLLPRFVRTFGPEESKKLVNAINFYNLQLERQSIENSCDVDYIDLFHKNEELKLEYLQDQIKEIAQYFVDNANECVWGTLTDNQKQIIIDSVLKERNCKKEIREKFVDVIANYTTVREIESGLVKTKTIDRFIIR